MQNKTEDSIASDNKHLLRNTGESIVKHGQMQMWCLEQSEPQPWCAPPPGEESHGLCYMCGNEGVGDEVVGGGDRDFGFQTWKNWWLVT